MAIVQVGDNYEMIFGKEGLEELIGSNNGTDLDGEVDLIPSEPIVVSDILQQQPPRNQQEIRDEARISSAPPRSQLHISQLPISYNSTPVESPLATPAPGEHVEMNIESRLRARIAPKPLSAEVSEAIALMDREILEEGPPKKRSRGRPKGSAKANKSTTITAVPKSKSGTPSAASNGTATGVKKRGRPHKALGLSMREVYLKSEPNYIPFGCEWHDPEEYPGSEENQAGTCPAKLQNLETLRRHVYRVHGQQRLPAVCKWAKCAKQNKLFTTEKKWRDHIEQKHMIPYSWHMGDGIQNFGIETLDVKKEPERLPEYLFRDGTQITPSIKDQQFENTAGMLERKRKLREIRQQAEENAPTDQEFRAQILGEQVQSLKRKESSN